MKVLSGSVSDCGSCVNPALEWIPATSLLVLDSRRVAFVRRLLRQTAVRDRVPWSVNHEDIF